MNREYTVLMSGGFPVDLGSAPKKFRNAWKKSVLRELTTCPSLQAPPKIKKLQGWKDLWRYRVGDQRLVYRVDSEQNEVHLMMLGHRSKIYDRLGHESDTGPKSRIVANEHLHYLVEREPTQEQLGLATIQDASEEEKVGTALPFKITSAALEDWGVESSILGSGLLSKLEQCEDEESLLSILNELESTHAGASERILNGLLPPKIEDVAQKEVRVVREKNDDIEIDDAAERVLEGGAGKRKLSDFLLKLDPEQQDFVDRVTKSEHNGPTKSGPWMLKGGPGSGKSTVALYCIRNLLSPRQGRFDNKPTPKILFTTYTNSLASAAKFILSELKVENSKCTTLDKVAKQYLGDNLEGEKVVDVRNQQTVAAGKKVFKELHSKDANFSFGFDKDFEFLFEEIEWVTLGAELESEKEYAEFDRTGRGRRLTKKQRVDAWKFHEKFREECKRKKIHLWVERSLEATKHVPEGGVYDYVFIDEAQDLKPAQLRLCLKLAKDPSGVFVTADSNQAIYGASVPWKRISEGLGFQGKTRILRKNYRTTGEIIKAIEPLIADAESLDSETLTNITPRFGDLPTLVDLKSKQTTADKLNALIPEVLLEERMAPDCIAVLGPTNKFCEELAGDLNPEWAPRYFRSKQSEDLLKHRGIKVLTMHAAKGLEFPITAVTGVIEGVWPWARRPEQEEDQEEKLAMDRRLLFVACSRAIRRLFLIAERNHPYLRGIDEDAWEID